MTVPAGGFSPVPTSAELDLVDALYLDAVLAAAGGPDDGSTKIVKEVFFASMDAAIRRGAITTDPYAMLKENYWGRVSDRSSDNTGRLIDDLVSGQMSILIDEWLDLPITVGRNKRTIIRFLTPRDWEIILAIRKENVSKAQHKYREAQTAAALCTASIAVHGTMEAAVRSGTMILPATKATV